MTRCWQVAANVWLGIAGAVHGGRPWPPGLRWRVDRLAADRALVEVQETSGLCPATCATSRSHTRGMGVAIVAPAGERVGVDVVAMERVSQRHARAVLSDDEWEALAPYAAVRPPLAWALKEAAAKAAGDPLRCFPDGLEIEPRPGGLRVRRSGPEQGEFEAGWETLGPFLYAWVHR